MDSLEDDHYASARWAGQGSRRRRQADAVAAPTATGMTPGRWVAVVVGLGCVTVIAAFMRWSAWWPHSDNRQNGVTIVGWAAAVTGALVWRKALANSPGSRRLLMLLAALFAALLGAVLGYALMVNATAAAK